MQSTPAPWSLIWGMALDYGVLRTAGEDLLGLWGWLRGERGLWGVVEGRRMWRFVEICGFLRGCGGLWRVVQGSAGIWRIVVG